MAEEIKYTEEELSRLNELSEAGKRQYELEKEKALKLRERREELREDRRKKRLEDDRDFLTEEQLAELSATTLTTGTTGTTGTTTGTTTGGGGGTDDDRLIDKETGRPRTVAQVVEIDRVKEIREMPVVTPPVYFTLDYNIEPIPRPDLNKVHGLYVLNKNISTRDLLVENPTYGFEKPDAYKKFVSQMGSLVKVRVNATLGTSYKLVIYNETDNTYFNDVPIDGITGFRSGFHTINSTIKKAEKLGQNKIELGYRKVNTVDVDTFDEEFRTNDTPEEVVVEGQPFTPDRTTTTSLNDKGDTVLFTIPSSSTEKVFKISLLKEGINTYDNNVPLYNVTETPPIKIRQLPNPTTTIKFDEDDDGFLVSTGNLEINHTPGANLGDGSYVGGNVDGRNGTSKLTGGVYDVDISISAVSNKVLSLNSDLKGGRLLTMHVDSFVNDVYTTTEIKDVDLLATVTNSVGNIKGTITIGKTCYRSCEILIRPTSIFTLSQ